MDLELVTVGTELLLGHTIDTNGALLGRALAAEGHRVTRRTLVSDEPEPIRHAVAEGLGRAGAVLTTGGLGPTGDDLTRQAVAGLFGRTLRFDPGVWAAIVERFRRLGREPAAVNRCQAEVPEGAAVLANRWGTAPGLWLEDGRGLVIMLPGVPYEMAKLLRHEVLPRLRPRSDRRVIRSTVVRTTSLPESVVGERIAPLEPGLVPLTVAYLPGRAGVDVRLTAWNVPPEEADRLLVAAAGQVARALEPHVYGEDREDLAAVLLERLQRRDLRLAVAESCTGGLVGARLTAVPGSSASFAGGVVCYDDRAKTDLLGVPPDALAGYGAVSTEVAVLMARGVARRFGVPIGLAVTGIAGPTGAAAGKPVGTVCFGWTVNGAEDVARLVLPGGRRNVRERAAQYLLYRLLHMVNAQRAS